MCFMGNKHMHLPGLSAAIASRWSCSLGLIQAPGTMSAPQGADEDLAPAEQLCELAVAEVLREDHREFRVHVGQLPQRACQNSTPCIMATRPAYSTPAQML